MSTQPEASTSAIAPLQATTNETASPATIDDPGDRGSLQVADRVVHKIAAQAAAEVEHTIRLPRRLSERLPGRRAQNSRVDTVITDGAVSVQVSIAVAYPHPVVEVTREVRRHVIDVVSRKTDLEVTGVDVVVQQLRRDDHVRRAR